MDIFKYELGLEAKDLITGFKGIITARVQFLTGCSQYQLQPQDLTPDGKKKDAEQFDENRIAVIGEGVKLADSNTPDPETKKKKTPVRTGGPADSIQRQTSRI